jgi:hypothetical protein
MPPNFAFSAANWCGRNSCSYSKIPRLLTRFALVTATANGSKTGKNTGEVRSHFQGPIRYDWRVGQQGQSVGFGEYLRDAIQAAGFATPTHFARTVNTDPSVVLRWISEEQRPTIRSLERVAPRLGKTINEMVGAAYRDRLTDEIPPPTAHLHPLGYEVGRMLAEDSPITPDDRRALAAVLDRMLEPYRRDMRRRRSLGRRPA